MEVARMNRENFVRVEPLLGFVFHENFQPLVASDVGRKFSDRAKWSIGL